MDSNSLILTLINMKGWGPNRIYSYVSKHGFNYSKCVNGLVDELNDEQKAEFKYQLVKAKETLKNNFEKGIGAINLLEEKFPKKLYFTTDKCVFLYYIGDINLLAQKSIAIIGTRKPEEEFIEKGIKATKYFAEKGYVIVSGLALGCDSVAHEACLDVHGKTIAVLPSPCDNPQPVSNKLLAKRIINNGGLLISEYSTGVPVSKFNYPQRDRIQSLLTTVILIIQAEDSSGTMIATKKAIKDNKTVFAIKGNKISIVHRYVDVDDEYSLEDVKSYIL